MSSSRTDSEAVVKLVINGQQAMASLKELTDTQRKLNSELRNMKPSDPGYKKIEQELQMVSRATSELRKQQQGLNNEAKGFQLSWKGIAAGIVSGGLVSKGLDLIANAAVRMKDALAEAGANRAVLTNALNGNAKEAAAALKMLMNFAAKTPEGLQQATDGFLKLVNRGIKPAREEMVNIGDVAASQKKSMDQYIEAILDAQTGENERLKEFGVLAKKNGDTVSFTFKGITKEVQNTEDAIYKALIGFGELGGVKGTMDVISKELVGVQSNIGDSWDQIYTKLGQKTEGFIYGFYNTYSSVLSYINEDLLSTESNAEKLTKAFHDQASEVSSLEKNVNPLLDRYDELKAKGKLNKDEQAELKTILQAVSNTIPGAVTNWNKLGDAMDLNTDKAREFIEIQQLLLKSNNKTAIDKENEELEINKKLRDQYQRSLNSGTTIRVKQGGGNSGRITTTVTPATKEELLYQSNKLKELNEAIREGELRLKGLNGDYLNAPKKNDKIEVPSTARSEGAINKQIEDLKDKKKDLDIYSKEYAVIVAKIKALNDELSGAKGKPTSAQKTEDSEKKKAITEFEKLNEAYNRLGIEQLDAQLSKNQKEIEQEGRKYETLIQQKRDFMNMDGATKFQKDVSQTQIDQLESDKKTALNNLAIRQEEEMMQKISDLRGQLTKNLETELGKETQLINKFYDQQEKDNLGNEKAIAELRLARETDLTDAKVREAERLEKEKQAIENEYSSLTGNKDALELAAIHSKYDAQVEALKEKFSDEIIATEEFNAAIDAINANRDAEISTTTKEKDDAKRQQIKDAAIESAQAVSDAVFTIAANNRQRETDIKLNALETERDRELSNKNLSERQKEAINKKFDDKARAIKLKAWKDDKAASISQAIINGALAVTKALPNIPLSIASGIAAAAQLAVIVAQKPPEFADGVRDFEGGPAIVGEAGAEIVDENGKLWLATKATLANLQPGANVYNAAETSSMMGNLGSMLYQPASYSIDTNGARDAEKQYRSTSTGSRNFNQASGSSSAENTTGSIESRVFNLEKNVSDFIAAQARFNELPINLYYNRIEDFEKNVKEVRLAQGG